MESQCLIEKMRAQCEIEDFRAFTTLAALDVYYKTTELRVVSCVVFQRDGDAYTRLGAYIYEDCGPELLPYIPFTLAFREFIPCARMLHAVCEHWKIDLVLADGCGRWHPTRSGLACAFPAFIGLNAIGIAKNPLVFAGNSHTTQLDEFSELEVCNDCFQFVFAPNRSNRRYYISPGFQCDSTAFAQFLGFHARKLIACMREADLVGRKHCGKSGFQCSYKVLSGSTVQFEPEFERAAREIIAAGKLSSPELER